LPREKGSTIIHKTRHRKVNIERRCSERARYCRSTAPLVAPCVLLLLHNFDHEESQKAMTSHSCLQQENKLQPTFKTISVISWRSVLLVEETGVPGENHRPAASHWRTWSHNVVSSTPRYERNSISQR